MYSPAGAFSSQKIFSTGRLDSARTFMSTSSSPPHFDNLFPPCIRSPLGHKTCRSKSFLSFHINDICTSPVFAPSLLKRSSRSFFVFSSTSTASTSEWLWKSISICLWASMASICCCLASSCSIAAWRSSSSSCFSRSSSSLRCLSMRSWNAANSALSRAFCASYSICLRCRCISS